MIHSTFVFNIIVNFLSNLKVRISNAKYSQHFYNCVQPNQFENSIKKPFFVYKNVYVILHNIWHFILIGTTKL